MRHLLLALLIALLPIRGWVGDAMAVAMLAPPAHSMNQAAQADAAPPCPDHAAPAASAALHGEAAADQHADAGSDHSHSSCDVCNGPAMALSAPAQLALARAHGLRVPPAAHFASSEPHRGIKPPIS
jgi:hypothetical protein